MDGDTLMSDKITMNGPCEFEMKVYLTNDETGDTAEATIGLGAFEFPTPEKVQDILEKNLPQLEASGFRPMGVQEAFGYFTRQRTGEAMAVPHPDEWDPIS